MVRSSIWRKFSRLATASRMTSARVLSGSLSWTVSKNCVPIGSWRETERPRSSRPRARIDGLEVHAFGDLAQAFRPVITGVHGSHVGEQCLGRADVAGGFFAANMLFAGLQRKAQGRAAAGIFGNADDAAGHVAFEVVAGGEEGGVRSAVTERDTKTLGAADGDVRAEFTRRFEERESEEIGGDGDKSAGLVSFGRSVQKNREWCRRCQDIAAGRRRLCR